MIGISRCLIRGGVPKVGERRYQGHVEVENNVILALCSVISVTVVVSHSSMFSTSYTFKCIPANSPKRSSHSLVVIGDKAYIYGGLMHVRSWSRGRLLLVGVLRIRGR